MLMDKVDNLVLEELRSLGSATVYEAAGRGKALTGFFAVDPSLAVVGPARLVMSPPGDNLAIHRAIATASRGDILVVDVDECARAGHWGEITTVAAQARGIAGLVINGTIRDSRAILARGFPVFHRGLCILAATKVAPLGEEPEAIVFGGCTIRAGDLVIADVDGVAIVEAERVGEVIEAARRRAADEEETMARLNAGSTTLEIFGWR
jgi:4-hydroxy-4-methyl-2-oxoglutarate aldolase